MYELRPYQDESVRRGIEFFRSADKTRPILVLPTGAGKSLVIASMAKELDGNILVIQPSKELLEQNFAKYEAVVQTHPDLEPAAIFSASVGIKERAKVTFATIGSIYKMAQDFADVESVIIDENHTVPPESGSMYMQFLRALPNAKVLGLTATPYRLKTYTDPFKPREKFSKINLLPRERPSFFNRFLHIVQPKELYEQGYLAPVNYAPLAWDGSVLKANTTGSEYTEKSMDEAMTRNQIMRNLPLIIEQAFKKGRKACLVFVRTVEEARQLAEATPFAEYVHAETPKDERARIIEAFKGGGIKTLFNVSVLTTGFDFPELDTIIVARPTMSLALFVQMVGRGIRLADKKTHCTVVDMCGNIKRFGKLEDLRIEEDPQAGWVLRNDERILSGVRLDEL
jgi:DNA repair protein RadD